MSKILIKAENMVKYFPVRGGIFFREIGRVQAVSDVSFEIAKGETFSLVGESGCGKTTTARSISRLYDIQSGKITFEGESIEDLDGSDLRALRRNIQIVFQEPMDSLNPRHTVRQILKEPFEIHGLLTRREREAEVLRLLDQVGLPQTAARKFAHEFSGGQRQRIGIARAIALKPKLLICDEPVSALDVSIQSEILNLLLQLQRDLGLTYLFIAHNLAVVRHISDRIGVMYLGKLVETAPAEELYRSPKHPYTKALLDSIPNPDPTKRKQLQTISGEIPSPRNPPSGCRFHTRCSFATDKCKKEEPILTGKNGHDVACHFPLA
jgi:oligopeptide transport system ATP-binding protein